MEEYVRKYVNKIKDPKIFFAPNIPEKKLANAINSYGIDTNPNEVIVLIDNTVFGGAKEGLMLTTIGVVAKAIAEPGKYVHLRNIEEISMAGKTISLNHTDFLDINMPSIEAVATVIDMISEIVASLHENNKEGGETPSSSETTESGSTETIGTEIKELQQCFGSDKVLLFKQMTMKQRKNFCKNCNLSDPGELLGFIDTTILNSGKDGLGFCEDRIVWRNFAFEEPQSISYEKLYDASYSKKGDELFIKIDNEEFKLQATNHKFDPNAFESMIVKLGEFWRNNCAELSEFEKAENLLVSNLPTPKGNYFRTLRDLMDKENKSLLGDPDNKKANQAACTLLSFAINFPVKINQDRGFHRELTKSLQSEYVTFEILNVLLKKASRILTDTVGAEATQGIIIETMFKPIFLNYVMYKMEVSSLEEIKHVANLKNITHPDQEIVENPIMGLLESRQRYDESDLIYQIVDRIFQIIVTQRDEYYIQGLSTLTGKEQNLYQFCEDLYQDSFNQPIAAYMEKIDKAIEQVFIRFFS